MVVCFMDIFGTIRNAFSIVGSNCHNLAVFLRETLEMKRATSEIWMPMIFCYWREGETIIGNGGPIIIFHIKNLFTWYWVQVNPICFHVVSTSFNRKNSLVVHRVKLYQIRMCTWYRVHSNTIYMIQFPSSSFLKANTVYNISDSFEK